MIPPATAGTENNRNNDYKEELMTTLNKNSISGSPGLRQARLEESAGVNDVSDFVDQQTIKLESQKHSSAARVPSQAKNAEVIKVENQQPPL